MTTALVVAQVIMPVQTALADQQTDNTTGPAGNNGTVKINNETVEDDSGVGSEPHLNSCTVNVRWYGFDEGARDSTVTFVSQSPTADSQLVSPIGPQDADFVAPARVDGNTVSNEESYTLSFTGAPDAQGYHVKATVYTDGSQGNNTKSKVFWLPSSCATPERITTPNLSLEGVCGSDNDKLTVTASNNYTASAPTWNNSVVSVTFTINAGLNKVFAANGLKTITVTANEVNTAPCQTPPTRIKTPEVNVDGVCGIGNDTVNYVTETADYTSTISWNQANTSATITFTIKDGVNKVFAANGTTTVPVTVNETDTSSCPREPQPCTATNNQYQQPWTYDGDTYPVAGASPNTPTAIKGTYEFVNDMMFSGLHVKTLGVESYVYGLISAGNTSILDVDTMGYTTYRTPMEARSRQTLPAYILLIDKDSTNAPSVADRTYLFFEPYYSELVQEGVWKTWDAYKNGDAIWYMSGTGQTLRTWDYFKANFPDATVLAYGFNQGTSNEGTDAYIKSMTFDCATTTFSAPGRGSAGGETPTTPTTPTLPTTPVIETPAQPTPGKGAVLPAELPKTGASFNYLSLAILASVLTYGAVYFAQGKRQYE